MASGEMLPPHIHAAAAENEAKFWLDPIELAKNEGFRSGELKEIERIVGDNLNLLMEAWRGFFNA